MVDLSRLELLTFRLSNEHSTVELQVRLLLLSPACWGRRNRTFDAGSKDRCLTTWLCPRAGEEGIEPPSLGLKPRILADELFPQKFMCY
jgi:hypothetical protein